MTRAQRLVSIGAIDVAWKVKLTSLKSGGFALAVGLLLSSLGLVTTARADNVIPVAGSAAGTFFDASNPDIGTSVHHLSFLGTSFDTSSDLLLELGTFTLANGTADYDPYGFKLTVTFTAPPGASGTPNPLIGTVIGTVHGNDGFVEIKNFPTSTFIYDGGSFDFLVNNFYLEKPKDVNNSVEGVLYGSITNLRVNDPTSSVPEPRPYDFLITAIGGVVFLLYRHRYGRC